jgi:uncharacterized damage-inducible protein DinB
MTNKEFFIKTWEREHATTAKAIRSLPDDLTKLNMQHHPKFRSPWQLVNHIAPHAKELAQAISEGRMHLVNEGMFPMEGPNIYKSVEDAAKDLETYSAKLKEAASGMSDADWEAKMVPVYWGPMKVMEGTVMQHCWMMLFDTIHHRGQLTSYYRMLGVAQPELMGPTQEVEEAMFAKMN